MKKSNWYVIYAHASNEQRICDELNGMLGKELYEHCFVPLCERHYRKDGNETVVKEPLFPGYLFIITDNIDEVAASLWKVSKFKRLLRSGDSFVPLWEEEVSNLKAITDKDYNVSFSKGILEGDSVTVTEGPMQGFEGLIRKIDRHKRAAFIELPFLGESTRVRIPLEIVEKR
jgi:transcription antitermination factor NusG